MTGKSGKLSGKAQIFYIISELRVITFTFFSFVQQNSLSAHEDITKWQLRNIFTRLKHFLFKESFVRVIHKTTWWLLAMLPCSDCRYLTRQVFWPRFFHKTNGKVPCPSNTPLIQLVCLPPLRAAKAHFLLQNVVFVRHSFQFTFSGNYSVEHTRVAQTCTLGEELVGWLPISTGIVWSR